jgi:hypothetical protein
VVFNGTELVIYDDNYKIIFRVPAYSGKPSSSKLDQDKVNYGPIPEGTYLIYPAEVGNASYLPWTWPGADYPFWDWGAWGSKRVPLHAHPANPVTDRSGFFLHGGSDIGSAGCVDIGFNDARVIGALADAGHQTALIVTYSFWNGRVPYRPWLSEYPVDHRGGTNGSGGRVSYTAGNWPRI